MRRTQRGLVLVCVAFAISRIGYAFAGVRFDARALHPAGASDDQWQLLDTKLLSHELLRSIWYLHSQPPLYNLFCGVLLQLPRGLQDPVVAGTFLILGLLMACATYLLLLELTVPLWVSLLVALLVIADPANALYENWLSWSYPAAAFLTCAAYCCARFLRTRRNGWGIVCFACLAAVVLDDSTYQWVWLAVVVAAVLWFMRSAWRQVLSVAAVPILLVGIWYVKDAVLFGTAATSSWLGMNLASMTVDSHPRSLTDSLVRAGRLSALATTSAFGPLSLYVPRYARPVHTGVAVLDERTKSDSAENLNNLAYVEISREYLDADLSYIEAEPGHYARTAGLAAELWFVPPDQYPFLEQNLAKVSSYARAYDAVALLQVHGSVRGSVGLGAATEGVGPPPSELSYTTIAEYALALVVGPVALFIRRVRRGRSARTDGRDQVLVCMSVVMWSTIAYGLVATSLVSIGENMRFQFELGTLPAVAATTVVVSLATGRGQRRGAHGGGEPSPSSPVRRPLNRRADSATASAPSATTANQTRRLAVS